MSAAPPLAGLRVLEAGGGVPAAFCARQFAQWGAHVAATAAQQAALAAEGPAWRKGTARGSALADLLAVGKVTLDGPLAQALASADVAICGGEAPFEAWPALRARFPAVVWLSVSAFGLDGPRAGREACAAELEALSGYLSLNGPPDGPPMPAPGRLIDFAVGANGFVGALAALIRRERTGRGDLVEVSGLETVAGLVPYLRDQQQGHASMREGGTPEGARLLKCLDGYVSVAPAIPAHLDAYREVLGLAPHAADETLFAGERRQVVERVAAAFAPFAAKLSVEEVFLGLQARGVVCGKVQSPEEVLQDRQLLDRGFFETLAHPAGAVPLAGAPARIHMAPAKRQAPAPRLAEGAPPLEGLRVLDLTQAWIGPLVGMILADLGAEVIKVEGPSRPDIWRFLGQAEPGAADALDTSCYFNAVNRNKKGVALDLTSGEGAEAFLRLVGGADAVIENFTPQVLARWGLDYQRLKGVRPDLVLTSFSGFGAFGPHASFKANGSSIEALAGWDALNRDAAGRPVLMGGYPADPICGLQMAACTLAALFRRARTGAGAHVEGSMLEAAAGYVGDALLAEALRTRGCRIAEPAPAARVEPAPDGEDRWRVLTADGRSAPVATTLEALEEPQLAARGWFVELETPGQGRARHNGRFWRFHEARLPEPAPPPRLGQHTAEVLGAPPPVSSR